MCQFYEAMSVHKIGFSSSDARFVLIKKVCVFFKVSRYENVRGEGRGYLGVEGEYMEQKFISYLVKIE